MQFSECLDCLSVTPSDGSKTWGRSAVCKKEDLTTNKKKGRTWGPSSTHQRERVGGEEKCVHCLLKLIHVEKCLRSNSWLTFHDKLCCLSQKNAKMLSGIKALITTCFYGGIFF